MNSCDDPRAQFGVSRTGAAYIFPRTSNPPPADWSWSKLSAPPGSAVRLQIIPSPDQPFTSRPSGTNLDISPDGSTVVYHAQVGNGYQLVRRRLDSIEASPIAGTDRAQNPTFSPDGTQIAFYSAGAIKTVAVAGGAPVTVCEISGALPMLAWSDSGEIFFTQQTLGLSRVPEKGGPRNACWRRIPGRTRAGFSAWPRFPAEPWRRQCCRLPASVEELAWRF